MDLAQNLANTQPSQIAEVAGLSVVQDKEKNKQRKQLAELAITLQVLQETLGGKKGSGSKAESDKNSTAVLSFLYAYMAAIQKDQSTMSGQQLIDGKTTECDSTLELQMYEAWNSTLNFDVGQISAKIKAGGKHESENVELAQAQYNSDSQAAQSQESQEDAVVQASQGQTQSDASNLQMKAQMAQSVTSIMSTLVQMLGHITA
jgi:hypothetical protein